MTELQLYILLKLDSIISFIDWFLLPAFSVLVLSLIGLCILWIIPHAYSTGDEYGRIPDREDIRKCKTICKGLSKSFRTVSIISLIIWFPSALIQTLLPTTKEMAVIYVVPKVINNKTMKKIPNKLLELSSEWLDELKPDNIKSIVNK